MGFGRTRGLCLALAGLFLLSTTGSALGEGSAGAGSRSSRTVRSTERAKRGPRPDSLTTARRRGRLSKAQYSLERARSLFDLPGVRDEYGRVSAPDPHDGTMLLRDLALSLPRLFGADAREARRILARPTDGKKDRSGDGYMVPRNKQRYKCFDSVIEVTEKFPICVHWVTDSKDRSTKAYVNNVVSTLKVVGTLTLNNSDFNFRSPRSDLASKNHGPNKSLDVYLTDLGGQGVYGYCTSDELKAARKQKVSAYCVLDNNYSPKQFDSPPPEVNGMDALEVTTAHEFFHAVQFAYDWREARWLMEGSAVAMEDEIFDDINAHLAFVDDSALHQPEVPLDAFEQSDDGENFEYGAWLFFRFMSEFWCQSPQGGSRGPGCSDPEMTRVAFEQAAVPGTGAYDAVAQSFALKQPFGYGTIAPAFAIFGVWNYGAWDYGPNYYEEVASYRDVMGGVGPPLDAFHHLLAAENESVQGELSVDGLATRYVSFWPGYGTAPGDLTVTVDVSPSAEGAMAVLMRVPLIQNGVSFIPLDTNGHGSLPVDYFDQDPAYSEVVLVLSNAGQNDDVTFSYTAESETDQS